PVGPRSPLSPPLGVPPPATAVRSALTPAAVGAPAVGPPGVPERITHVPHHPATTLPPLHAPVTGRLPHTAAGRPRRAPAAARGLCRRPRAGRRSAEGRLHRRGCPLRRRRLRRDRGRAHRRRPLGEGRRG